MRRHLGYMVMLFAVACAGCGGKDTSGDLYNLTHYGNVQPQKIQFQGITWGILDKPEEGRMIVVSLGAHSPLTDEKVEQTEGAAQSYLERSNRDCTVTARKLASATDNSFEFFYSCNK